MIFLLVLLSVVQSNCPCQDYQTQQYCLTNDHCQWTNNQCQQKECSAIQTESSCKYPDCFMDINQCKPFTDCSEIAANDCLEYPGCHPELGICKSFAQCNQLTSALYCGGAKTTDGRRCYWLREEKQCASFKECSDVSVENCDQVGFECDIDTVSNTCQIPGYVQNCSTLQNKEECNEQFSNQLCLWMNEKCERVKCRTLEQPNCSGICSWTGEDCKNCIDSEDTYGQLLYMIIVAIMLIS